MKTAIALDYDETLAHSEDDIKSLKAVKLLRADNTLTPALRSRLYIIDIYDEKNKLTQRMWGVKRPHVDLFLRFCFAAFDYVILWSAGTHLYVDRVEKITFRNAGHPDPHYVFSREDCLDTGDDITKPLRRLHILEPELEKTVPLSNMVILDNKESNFDDNPENALLIDDYAPKAALEALIADEKSLLMAILQLARRRLLMNAPPPRYARLMNECISEAESLLRGVN